MALSNIPSCLVFNQLFIFFLLLLPHAMSISFEFPSFSTNDINLTLQGDAFTNPDGLQLTKDTRGSSIGGSVGCALYHERVRLWDNSTGKPKVTDFTTHFSFIITSVDKSSADGFTFFITPFNSNIPNNSAGGFLGLFSNESAINGTQNQIVAVEFDTYRNPWDPSDNHVGIDVDSIVSKANVTLQTSIKNRPKAYAWVSYNSTTQNLSVFLTFADILVFNGSSSLSYIVDLKTILPEWVSVGFSGATDVVTELHTILSWSFSSTLDAGDGFPQPKKTGDGLTQNKQHRKREHKKQIGVDHWFSSEDIKSSNIILDSNFNAKLGDFGLARLVDHELGSQTTVLVGTIGYLAPECLTTGKASKESDVYSFWVVCLEIACGRNPIEPRAEPSKVRLLESVWDLYGNDQLLEAIDKGLSMEFDKGK
ncbi:agglutinin-2 [Quercus suber]|uniref:Agglutinin-2 n=1 Tax=Quercus suber TaxID=58331 RepID=A0AAW0IJZ7_QUESU